MKKVTILVLICMLCLLSIAGCGTSDGTTSSSSPASSSVEAGGTDPMKEEGFTGYPMKTDQSLRIWTNITAMQPYAEYSDVSESPFHTGLAQMTGVDIKWEFPATGADATQAYYLMLASDNLPDIIYTNNLNNRGEDLIRSKRAIILDDWIKDYAPNLWQYLNSKPDTMKAVQTDSKHFYAFPFLRDDPWLATYRGPVVREDLLKKTGLNEPVTIADWDVMLHAMKSLVDVPLGTYSKAFLQDHFSNAFGFYYNYYIEDNSVKLGYAQDKYKDFLQLMSKWYKEGILDPDFLTMDDIGFKTKLINEKVGAFYTGATAITNFRIAVEDNKAQFGFIPVSVPVAQKGDVIKFYQGEALWNGYGAMITTACKDVALACRFLDYGYSKEGIIYWNYGKEGVSFNYIDGKPVLAPLVTEAPEGKAKAIMRYSAMGAGNGISIMLTEMMKQKQNDEGNAAVDKWIENTGGKPYTFPVVSATAEEAEELSTLETSIKTYADEMYCNFILGAQSLDDFDKYLKNLESMGVKRLLEIKNQQYKRYSLR